MSTVDILPEIQHHLQSHSGIPKSLVFALVPLALLVYIIRQWALPKPIPGIPYRPSAVSSLLGDFMAIGKYVASDNVTFYDWVTKQSRELNSPIFQIFPRPFGRPLVVVNDFRESQDILMRRGKEFDRSSAAIDTFRGIVPNHHIVQQTNATWKSHRRLLQDLMSPGFLDGVAAPVIHHHASNLVRLWDLKAQSAQGRPFDAAHDIYNTALDAVHGFAYGQGFEHHANRPALEYHERKMSEIADKFQSNGSADEPIQFPTQEMDIVIKSVLTITSMFAEVQGSFISKFKWPILMRMPTFAKSKEIKDEAIRKQIQAAVERTQTHPDPSTVRSAVDNMVRREIVLADKEGRAPDFFSTTMFDEIFGFVIAGHDTTSTTFAWGVKLLADNPHAQERLRSAIQEAFSEAKAERRSPTAQEITSIRIPYLDAVQEEILRCAGTVQAVDREALVDTTILGHQVPKGTVIIMPTDGASIRSPAFDIEETKRHASSQEAKKSGKSRHEWDPVEIGAFNPERWLANDQGEFDAASGPQMAFSLGTRACFGKRLGYVQARMLLTLIVWNFELLRCPDELSTYGHKPGLTTEPSHCFVRLRKVQL